MPAYTQVLTLSLTSITKYVCRPAGLSCISVFDIINKPSMSQESQVRPKKYERNFIHSLEWMK